MTDHQLFLIVVPCNKSEWNNPEWAISLPNLAPRLTKLNLDSAYSLNLQLLTSLSSNHLT